MLTKLITAPAVYPVSVDEIQDHLRMDSTSIDHILDGLISSATNQAENIMGRALITQTWAVVYDSWSEMTTGVVLPLGRLQSVSSIKYNDTDGVEQTVSTDDYLVYGIGTDEGKIIIHSDSNFTYPDLLEKDPITVTFVCGYGLAAAVPGAIKTAIKLLVSKIFEDADVDNAVDSFLVSYKLRGA